MYASALASNKKYRFAYLLPSHNEGDYWKDVERGMQQAITRFPISMFLCRTIIMTSTSRVPL